MRVEQCTYSPASGWSGAADMQTRNALILVFGGVDLIARPDTFSMLRDRYPSGTLILVSTAGEIAGDQVRDESLVCTAISFDATPFRVLSADAASFATSRDCGLFIGTELSDDRLRHILLLSEGTLTNGDQLVGGLKETTPS
ncbi:MAG: FIST N-terminal domain-containing protein, partial [Bacteroidota bacterium]